LAPFGAIRFLSAWYSFWYSFGQLFDRAKDRNSKHLKFHRFPVERQDREKNVKSQRAFSWRHGRRFAAHNLKPSDPKSVLAVFVRGETRVYLVTSQTAASSGITLQWVRSVI
jgi:hypothetical protein